MSKYIKDHDVNWLMSLDDYRIKNLKQKNVKEYGSFGYIWRGIEQVIICIQEWLI